MGGSWLPRRAAALWRSAAMIAASGCRRTRPSAAAARGRPYTARALLCLAFHRPSAPARDVNLGRVAARCYLGVETAPGARLDAALEAHRPAAMAWRDYTLALFDVVPCSARRSAACQRCPLAPDARHVPPRGGVEAAAQAGALPGSMRQLRGASSAPCSPG